MYSTHPLGKADESIARAVIVIHGLGGAAGAEFSYVRSSAMVANRVSDVLVMAPRFESRDEAPIAEGDYQVLKWGDDWAEGGDATNGSGLSSFGVVDRLIQRVATDFYNVDTVVIAGHSAGGQFVNRYVAFGRGAEPPLEAVYLVANPSTYLYLTGGRYDRSHASFVVPQDCPAYNQYRYGLESLNRYTTNVGPSAARAQMTGRRTHYLIGSIDIHDAYLAHGCEAMLQGQNRLERAVIYERYTRLGSTSWPDNATFQTVWGVGHDSNAIYGSPEAREILFNPSRAIVVVPNGR